MTDQPVPKPPVETDTEKIPELLPILPLFDAALFPKMVLPLVVMQGESVRLVDEAMAKNRIIGLVVSKKPEEGLKPAKEDLAEVGTSALILKMAKTQDNRTQLLVQGLHRFKVKSWENSRPYLRARVEVLQEKEVKDNETEALMSNLVGQFIRIVELSPGLPPEIGQLSRLEILNLSNNNLTSLPVEMHHLVSLDILPQTCFAAPHHWQYPHRCWCAGPCFWRCWQPVCQVIPAFVTSVTMRRPSATVRERGFCP